ncbi:PH domain-containing protein [Streptomyces sp. NBC_00554]|uniref:PH domain-containing protein n=1 Tax=unclassified Streptomyces TaxID=2593676 RepID=UPI00352DE779|nr:PH domain-containing protein [Streptomyces sp. NBC_00564]WUC49863.1 PH domain-containing protein [Streptomyces sp. NBC_00554]
MTTPDHQSPTPDASRPESKDRIYRSPAGMVGGALLLALVGWLGIDALVSGEDRTPWLALAAMLLVVPLIVAFTLRPAVYANADRLAIRNPLRLIVLPWGQVAGLRSGYSNEVLDQSGRKFQLWAVPVSLRGRKKAAQREARQAADASGKRRGGGGGLGGFGGLGGGAGGPASRPAGPVRAEADRIMDELRELRETRGKAESAQGEVTVRWAYEVVGPAVAGAVLLVVLLAIG